MPLASFFEHHVAGCVSTQLTVHSPQDSAHFLIAFVEVAHSPLVTAFVHFFALQLSWHVCGTWGGRRGAGVSQAIDGGCWLGRAAGRVVGAGVELTHLRRVDGRRSEQDGQDGGDATQHGL